MFESGGPHLWFSFLQINGTWGLLATGLLASPRLLLLTYKRDDNPGLFYSFGQGQPNGTLLGCQVVSILFIAGWTFVTMLPFFMYLNYRGWLRSDSYEEIVGLDVSYHGGGMRLSVDDGAGIQFVEAHRKRRLEEAKKDHHQNEVHTEETAPALGTVDTSSGQGDPQDDVERNLNQASQDDGSPIQFRLEVVEIEEPSTYALGPDILYS